MINSDNKSKHDEPSTGATGVDQGKMPPDVEPIDDEATEDRGETNADMPDASEAADAAAGGHDETPDGLREENNKLRDQVLRLMAEMENLRRRTEREKSDTANYAVSNFARDVLSINDNLERAMSAVPADALESDPALKGLHEGVLVTRRELLNTLERYAITPMEPKGKRFDPNLHQAMFEMDDPEVPAGTVLEVMQPGFMIGERVLRPAMVGVSKGGPKEAPPAAANDDRPEDGAAAPDVAAPGAGDHKESHSPNDDPTVAG